LFTVAGTLASTAVGAALGWLGMAVLSSEPERVSILAGLIVTGLAAGRELGWSWIPLPQLGRQTNGRWARDTRSLSAFLWGLDLGLVFTTWFTFSGIWVLVVLAVLGASPTFGAALLGSYWVGRAMSVWLAPLAMRDASATPELVRAVNRQYGLVRLVHVGSLAWIAIVLGVMLLTLTPLSW
jgi:hypothetical protein